MKYSNPFQFPVNTNGLQNLLIWKGFEYWLLSTNYTHYPPATPILNMIFPLMVVSG